MTQRNNQNNATIAAALIAAVGAVVAAVVTGFFGLAHHDSGSNAGGDANDSANHGSSNGGSGSAPGNVADHNDVPVELIGSWQGTATTANAGTFAVGVNLQQGSVGEYIGAIQIPVASCVTDLILNSAAADSVNVRARVKSGACGSGTGNLTVQDGQMSYRFVGDDGTLVSGTLTHAG
jgi:hypothetical protein